MSILISLLIFSSFCFAGVGEILSLNGGSDAKLSRGGVEQVLAVGTALQVGDKIRSENSHVVFLIYPKIQMSLGRGSEMSITSHLIDEANEAKSSSILELIKGIIRVQVIRDESDQVEHKIDANGVSFAVRGTEFEVTSTDEEAELDVIEGEVEVSSPYVQTFVPEIVKRNEGFKFSRKAKRFERRAFRKKMKDAYLLEKDSIRRKSREWKSARKAKRKLKRERKAGARKSPRQ